MSNDPNVGQMRGDLGNLLSRMVRNVDHVLVEPPAVLVACVMRGVWRGVLAEVGRLGRYAQPVLSECVAEPGELRRCRLPCRTPHLEPGFA